MFRTLSERLQTTFKHLKGQARLSETHINDAMREVRVALLEADVALPVVKDFIQTVSEKSLGENVSKSLQPGQVVIKIVNDTLVDVLGEANVPLELNTQPPAVILMAGLQGSGKTTSSAKLAKFLTEQHNKKVMLTSADVYRPAAIDQLKRLAGELNIACFPTATTDKPTQIALEAIDAAKREAMDVLIIDTAGRLHIDDAMMQEIQAIHQTANPAETLFVVDSMTGQDAANTAKAFNDALPLTGVILTKADGDARGGAALSIRAITGKPIKFMGIGEKTDALQAFHPERVASQILGMGDILSLVEEAERKLDKDKQAKFAKKLRKGKGFTLDDFRDQLLQMNKLGGIGGLMNKLPGMGNLPAAAAQQVDDKQISRTIAIINSMTPQERNFPDLVKKGSRKKRIAKGSGTQIQDINRLIKQFTQMQKMMKKFKNPAQLKSLLGRLPLQ